jgi:hypothetical protein
MFIYTFFDTNVTVKKINLEILIIQKYAQSVFCYCDNRLTLGFFSNKLSRSARLFQFWLISAILFFLFLLKKNRISSDIQLKKMLKHPHFLILNFELKD